MKINIAHTPIQASLSDRYISDTILARLKERAPLNFQALGHFLSNDPKRYDLTYLHNRISVEIGPSQLPAAAPFTEVPSSAASPSDAPAAFITDRQPRAGGKWGRGNHNRQRGDNDAQSSRSGNRNSKQSNRGGVPDWFNGDKQKYDRWCFNRRPGGKYDQRVKEMEAQLRDKRKRDTDEEADHAETAPPAQKLCFNLECEATGSDLLDELSGMGPVAQMADTSPLAEEAQSFGSESDSESKSVPEASESDWTFESDKSKSASAKCKQRSGGNRSHKSTANSGHDTKEKPAKTPNTSNSSHSFSSYLRIPILLFAFLFACCTQLGNAAEVIFGNAVGNIFFGFMGKIAQCVPQNSNRRILSGAVLLGIFIFLVMISSTFSERITIPISSVHEFPRHSNSTFEALLTTDHGNRMAQAVGNHSPFSLCWVVDSGASCHICNDSSLFVNLKPCNVKISTAKSGESIIATGIGDIRLNTWSEQGQPISIVLQQGYLVSEARRNLLSVSCLSKQKIQTVLPSENPIFAAGIYDCRHGNRSDKIASPLRLLTIFILLRHLPTAQVCLTTIHG